MTGGVKEVLARRIRQREANFVWACKGLDEAPRCPERRAAYNAALRVLDRAQVALGRMMREGGAR